MLVLPFADFSRKYEAHLVSCACVCVCVCVCVSRPVMLYSYPCLNTVTVDNTLSEATDTQANFLSISCIYIYTLFQKHDTVDKDTPECTPLYNPAPNTSNGHLTIKDSFFYPIGVWIRGVPLYYMYVPSMYSL